LRTGLVRVLLPASGARLDHGRLPAEAKHRERTDQQEQRATSTKARDQSDRSAIVRVIVALHRATGFSLVTAVARAG
jgi:hypothetical protein